MKILIITQNEPFYLKDNLSYLLNQLQNNIEIVGCVVTSASPFGKKESFIKKSLKTLRIFGLRFFIYYSFKFIYSKLFKDSVVKFLKKNNIPVIQLKKSINSYSSLSLLKSYSPDLLVSILGNQIFKKNLINLAHKGCINLHTALLPKYRGLMPTFWVLKNNEKFTGVSVFFVDEGIDSGPIIVQKKILVENKTQAELIKLTKRIGMDAICEALNIIKKNEYIPIENTDSEKTYFSFPTRQDVKEFYSIGKKFY